MSRENEPRQIDPSDYTTLVNTGVRKVMNSLSISPEFSDDLMGAGYLGLVEAAERFDESRGVPFEAYAALRIRGAVLDGFSKICGVNRTAHRKARAYRALLEKRAADEMDQEEIDSPEGKLARVFEQAANAAFTYRLHLVEDVDNTLASDESDSPEELVARKEADAYLKKKVRELPERECAVFELYYFESLSFVEISRKLGLSKGFVSRLHSRGMDMLRKELLKTGTQL
ncbi:sigma-70 family RNA polymerase sigma factor [bacterium]|nr:sigma-70 family RNA polymerase sigma factor [bacterium]